MLDVPSVRSPEKHQIPRPQIILPHRPPHLELLRRSPRQIHPRHPVIQHRRISRAIEPICIIPPQPIRRPIPTLRFRPPCTLRRRDLHHRRPRPRRTRRHHPLRTRRRRLLLRGGPPRRLHRAAPRHKHTRRQHQQAHPPPPTRLPATSHHLAIITRNRAHRSASWAKSRPTVNAG